MGAVIPPFVKQARVDFYALARRDKLAVNLGQAHKVRKYQLMYRG